MIEYDRLIVRIEPFTGPQRYEVFVEGEAGEGHGHFDPPFEGRDVENFALRMTRSGRGGTRRLEMSETARAKQFGHELFAALFQGEVRDLYHSCLAMARSDDRGLRLTLALTKVPELMDVPWEYLYDDPNFLAVSTWTPVVRYLDVPHPLAPLSVRPPLRVLGMISDASDLAALDVEGERRRLEEALRPLCIDGRVEVHWTQEATLDALLRKLRHGEFHIFHFVGHGAYDETSDDGVLQFEDPAGRSHEITGERLGTILNDHRSLRLVVLNACEGARSSGSDPFAGVAASLAQRGIPAVVAMQFEISDAAALTFAAHFYDGLALGHPVDTALADARQGIFASGNELEWGTPVLFLHSSDGRVFDVQGDRARSEHARLSVAVERPPVAAADEPVEWRVRVENTGRPSLFRVTPRDQAGQPLDDPTDLLSGEDAMFTWTSIAEPDASEVITVTAAEAGGGELAVRAQARVSAASGVAATDAAETVEHEDAGAGFASPPPLAPSERPAPAADASAPEPAGSSDPRRPAPASIPERRSAPARRIAARALRPPVPVIALSAAALVIALVALLGRGEGGDEPTPSASAPAFATDCTPGRERGGLDDPLNHAIGDDDGLRPPVRLFSPDCSRYARLVEPDNRGLVQIVGPDGPVRVIDFMQDRTGDADNDLMGLAWSRDSTRLVALFDSVVGDHADVRQDSSQNSPGIVRTKDRPALTWFSADGRSLVGPRGYMKRLF